MQAYHGKEALKASLISQMQGHYDADEIIHGTYWEKGKGCAVGCITHTSNTIASPHQAMVNLMDVPIQLAFLIDDLFEALPNGHAKEFPLRFLKAIRPGANLSRIWAQFAHWMLTDPTIGTLALPNLPDNVKTPTAKIAELLGAEGAGETLSAERIAEGDAAARDARDARDAWAAWAARAARDAWTVWAAWAAWTVWAARDARDARDAWAAWDARDAWAAWDAIRDEIAKAQADKLIELLQEV